MINLTTPILNNIATFDARAETVITFQVIGGTQVAKNNLVIRRVSDNEKVYDKIETTFSSRHSLPANTLENGVNYKAEIRTGDLNGLWSDFGEFVFFWCFSKPSIIVDNRVYSETHNFTSTYSQAENDPLQSYKYILYDSNKNPIAAFNERFSVGGLLTQEITGLKSGTTYYIEVLTISKNENSGTSGLVMFKPEFERPRLEADIVAKNLFKEGSVKITIDTTNVPQTSDSIKIQKRSSYELEWVDVVVLPYKRGLIEYTDRFVANGERYNYSFMPVSQGVSGARVSSQEVRVDFEGVFISDKDSNYHILYNLEKSDIENVMTNSIFTPLSTKYPVTASSELSYASFSVGGLIILDEVVYGGISKLDIQKERRNRRGLLAFLKNGRPKIYRDIDGDVRLVSVTGNVTESSQGSLPGVMGVNVNLIEVGEVNYENLVINDLV